jgi:hypothetical protein
MVCFPRGTAAAGKRNRVAGFDVKRIRQHMEDKDADLAAHPAGADHDVR